jgi:hypothetical protein
MLVQSLMLSGRSQGSPLPSLADDISARLPVYASGLAVSSWVMSIGLAEVASPVTVRR